LACHYKILKQSPVLCRLLIQFGGFHESMAIEQGCNIP
jgi:hypothetical protein